ncbi:hypothetical protein C5C13_11475 [Clavibacter michiganensis]|nr:hypothetical protein C5C13_11475 [Clavibacter michiganensis]
MELAYADEAADKLDFYDEHDALLADAFDRVIGELEAAPPNGAVRLRQTYLKPPGAYAVSVTVPGRRDRYMVLWQFEEPNTAFIKFAGRGLEALDVR